ncbi:SPW repeat protein [Streptomyces fimicarius]|uniref:SPW repeat protein n=1 Tax=Streptomyces TaxID=1883 RepID=UPI000A38FD92|nr:MULTISPECIES: SPW repeat protein [Streptomyces]MCX4707724.1 SPW repeat protein [Streptomyces griseus]MDX3340175.1 SPW repeat protein [Streptomyces sp. ME02-6979.5a]MDX3595389.1 SPW repeat protein [Streptomyces sp. ID03-2B]QXQ95902.1 SPW repeat protein [Streptomyces sp. WY228]
MSNVSHARHDISGHPDASEMRARYDRVMGGRDVALVDAPVFLVGLYCAVSPWVLHFTASQPALVTHNLVMGIAIAVLALGFTVMPERMSGLSWALCAIGAWIIVSTWVVGSSPDAGVVINNIIVGGLAVLLGMVCAGAAAKSRKT